MRVLRRWGVRGGVLLLLALPAWAQIERDSAEPPDSQPATLTIDRFADSVFGGVSKWLDWDATWGTVSDSVVTFYDQQGWDSEPDLYSLEMVLEVGAIPPWQVQVRLDRIAELAAERYGLDDDQAAQLRATTSRELDGLFSRHAGEILPLAAEAMQVWIAGEPITAEQVAHWTEVTNPLFDDARLRFNAATIEFMADLSPEQQQLVLADLSAANRRLGRVAELRAAAVRGEWDPADWGLPSEGFVAVLAETPEVQPASPAGATSQPASAPANDDPWAVYVREFIRRYSLTGGQQRSAWVVHDRLRVRRDLYERRFAVRAEALRRAHAPDEVTRQSALQTEHESTRARLFDQLKQRLERLPTRAQRRAAWVRDAEAPVREGAAPAEP